MKMCLKTPLRRKVISICIYYTDSYKPSLFGENENFVCDEEEFIDGHSLETFVKILNENGYQVSYYVISKCALCSKEGCNNKNGRLPKNSIDVIFSKSVTDDKIEKLQQQIASLDINEHIKFKMSNSLRKREFELSKDGSVVDKLWSLIIQEKLSIVGFILDTCFENLRK